MAEPWVALASAAPDRRVVDTANAGDAMSDANHGYVGADVTVGIAGGMPFRQARGWMRYALTTFDDTPVTVACTFLSPDGAAHSYQLVVEDSLIATKEFVATPGMPVVVEIAVPFEVTKGRSSIAVIIRATGGPTPALRQLRTIQDHNEQQ